MDDSNAQVKPRPVEVNVTEVYRDHLALHGFEPAVHSSLVLQIRYEHVSCSLAYKGIAVRSQSNLEERAS